VTRSFPPAFDSFDDHEPAALVPAEQPERVAGGDRVGSARRVGRQLLDGLRAEARTEAAERAQMLWAVAAVEEIDRPQRLGGHRCQA